MKKGFQDKDIAWLYIQDIRDGKNRRRYYKHEGRKKAFYIHTTDTNGNHHVLKISSAWDETVERVQSTAKSQGNRKTKKAKLRGPQDLKESESFKDILLGKQLDYPFLSDIQNRILTMRALGKSRPQIAKALSGGRGRRSYSASTIKYLLQTARQKIRESKGRVQMANISANLQQTVIDEMTRIAEHNGKTRNRVIMEACIEYIDNHEVPNVWETQHFTVDFNRFNRLRKRLMDLENEGFIGITGRGKDAQLHFK